MKTKKKALSLTVGCLAACLIAGGLSSCGNDPIYATSISLDRSEISLVIDGSTEERTFTLHANVEPTNYNYGTVEWSSSNTSYVTVTPSSDGKSCVVSPVAENASGVNVYAKIKTKDSELSAVCNVKVIHAAKHITSLEFSDATKEKTINIGETVNLPYTLAPTTNDDTVQVSVTGASGTPTVSATLNNSSVVTTGLVAGDSVVQLKAYYNGTATGVQSSTYTIHVVDPYYIDDLDSTVVPDPDSVEDTRAKDVQARELCNNFHSNNEKPNETASAVNWFLYNNKTTALSTEDLSLVTQTVKDIINYETGVLKFDIGSYFENVYYSELLLMAKKTTDVWNGLSAVEQEKADMAMDTYAYIYSIATDDDCNYITGVEWTGGYSKTGNPNVRLNNLLPLIYSYFYYDLDETSFNAKLSSFAFDSHLSRIQTNGATAAYTAWTATSPESTVTQKTFLENGGQVYYFNNGTKTDGGTGIGIPAIGAKGYKYNTYTISQWKEIFQNVGENTYSGGTCVSKYYYTQSGRATAYILDNKTSPYEDCNGMMKEFNFTNNGFNSLTTLASKSFEGITGFLRVMKFTEKGEFTTTYADAFKKIVYAGNQDFVYKYKNGYFNFSANYKAPQWMASDKVCTFYNEFWTSYDGLYRIEDLKTIKTSIIYGVNSAGTGLATIGTATRTTDTVTVGASCTYLSTSSEGQKTIDGVTFNAAVVNAVLNTSQGYEGNIANSVKVVLATAAKVTVYVGFSGTAADTYAKYMVEGNETRKTIGEKFTSGDHAYEIELEAGTYYFGITKKASSGGRFYGIKIADK